MAKFKVILERVETITPDTFTMRLSHSRMVGVDALDYRLTRFGLLNKNTKSHTVRYAGTGNPVLLPPLDYRDCSQVAIKPGGKAVSVRAGL